MPFCGCVGAWVCIRGRVCISLPPGYWAVTANRASSAPAVFVSYVDPPDEEPCRNEIDLRKLMSPKLDEEPTGERSVLPLAATASLDTRAVPNHDLNHDSSSNSSISIAVSRSKSVRHKPYIVAHTQAHTLPVRKPPKRTPSRYRTNNVHTPLVRRNAAMTCNVTTPTPQRHHMPQNASDPYAYADHRGGPDEFNLRELETQRRKSPAKPVHTTPHIYTHSST